MRVAPMVLAVEAVLRSRNEAALCEKILGIDRKTLLARIRRH